ncbi:MAG: dihydrolipoyl dehydrogenase [Solitalea-like symbiont of Tyrophagus putrescentiae]
MNYDIIVIGSGPGGYVAAIRAAQLNYKTAIIEKENLGGICLNWGCIPTKALLKSAQVLNYVKKANDFGINIESAAIDFNSIIKRSRNIANTMHKGVAFLMKKNKIDVIKGTAGLIDSTTVEIINEKNNQIINGKHIIIATGARSREVDSIKQDGENIIGYRQALSLNKLPKNMVVIGSGAIGTELSYFYSSLGTKVTIIEAASHIMPLEDQDVSNLLEKLFKEKGIRILTNTKVLNTKIGEVEIDSDGEKRLLKTDIILSAIGITPNIENLNLAKIGIETNKGKIVVNDKYETKIKGIYAIGDVIDTPALAHVASAEAINCIEQIHGMKIQPINYSQIPACTYTVPEVASIGLTEKQAIDRGYKIKVGKFPFSASGKAVAASETEGFVKTIYDAQYGELLGCHIVGGNATDMISEIVVAQKLETTYTEILKSIHPHPTYSEAIIESTADAYDECIHL